MIGSLAPTRDEYRSLQKSKEHQALMPAIKPLFEKCWLITRYLYLRLMREGFNYRAASLAYATLLAIVPLTIVGFRVLSYFSIFKGAAVKLQDFILQNFVASSADIIAKHLQDFLGNIHELSPYNIIFLIILDLLMLYNITCAFNSVWRAHPKANWSIHFLVYFLILMLSPIILGGVLVLGSFAYKYTGLTQSAASIYITTPLFIILPHAIILITFTIFNWILPSVRVRFIHALVGGILTAIIFELAKYGFTVYLHHFRTYQLLYGALSALPLFLIWLYVSWLIILFGALVTNLVAIGVPTTWYQQLVKKHE